LGAAASGKGEVLRERGSEREVCESPSRQQLCQLPPPPKQEERGEGEWSRVYRMAIGRGRQVLSSVLAKEVALSVQHGIHDSLPYQSSFTNIQTGVGMDAADDFIASVLAGGPVTSLVSSKSVADNVWGVGVSSRRGEFRRVREGNGMTVCEGTCTAYACMSGMGGVAEVARQADRRAPRPRTVGRTSSARRVGLARRRRRRGGWWPTERRRRSPAATRARRRCP